MKGTSERCTAVSLRERVARPVFRAAPSEREVRYTILLIDEIVGRAALIRRCRATFSRGEKDCLT
jgi:hypothetical protein